MRGFPSLLFRLEWICPPTDGVHNHPGAPFPPLYSGHRGGGGAPGAKATGRLRARVWPGSRHWDAPRAPHSTTAAAAATGPLGRGTPRRCGGGGWSGGRGGGNPICGPSATVRQSGSEAARTPESKPLGARDGDAHHGGLAWSVWPVRVGEPLCPGGEPSVPSPPRSRSIPRGRWAGGRRMPGAPRPWRPPHARGRARSAARPPARTAPRPRGRLAGGRGRPPELGEGRGVGCGGGKGYGTHPPPSRVQYCARRGQIRGTWIPHDS